jgi:hypothetical protein
MTPQDFYAAGFTPCPSPPPCWQQDLGAFFIRMQDQGAAYVRYLAGQHDEIEAFVGDWHHPHTYWYCSGCNVTLPQLLSRLS